MFREPSRSDDDFREEIEAGRLAEEGLDPEEARRTNEIGLRMALGAQRSAIVQTVVGETLRLVALGLALGVGGALAAVRLSENLLFGLSATDPPTIAAAVFVMIVVALVAARVPSSRAARIDPMSALRCE